MLEVEHLIIRQARKNILDNISNISIPKYSAGFLVLFSRLPDCSNPSPQLREHTLIYLNAEKFLPAKSSGPS
jgi:hypothetical protein